MENANWRTWKVGTKIEYRENSDAYELGLSSDPGNKWIKCEVKNVYPDHLIIDIPGISSHMWLDDIIAENFRLDAEAYANENRITISERIFNRLDELSITQKDFSEKTGIQQSTISEWKRKKANPSSDKILAICETIRVSPEWLLSGVDPAGSRKNRSDNYIIAKNSDLGKIIENWNMLHPNKRERVLGYMDSMTSLSSIQELENSIQTRHNWIIGISGSDMDNVYTYRVNATKEEAEKLLKAHMEKDKQEHIDIYNDEVFYEKENDGQKVMYGCTCFVDHHNDYTATPDSSPITIKDALSSLKQNDIQIRKPHRHV